MSVDLTPKPARTLDEAIRALDAPPPLPSGDPRYVDLSPGRGADPLHRVRRLLRAKQPGRWCRIAWSSHRGAGKTTELNRLRKDLAEQFHTIYFEMNVELDAQAVAIEDLLLVIARRAYEEMETLGVPVSAEVLQSVEQFFARVLVETEVGKSYLAEAEGEVKAGASTDLFGSLTSRLKALFRIESKERMQVQEVLRRYPGSLLDTTNAMLEEVHRALRTKLRRELLLIIDNLDRYPPAVAESLLVRNGDRLDQLKTNLIVTPPVSLIYSPEAAALPFTIEILPAVKLRGPADPYDWLDTSETGGPELLRTALSRRIELDRVIPERLAQDELIRGSGGSIRDLLRLALSAILEADGDTVTLLGVRSALKRERAVLRDRVNLNGWAPTLAWLRQNKQPKHDQAFRDVLHARLAFLFNGDGWYDVHPLIADLPEIEAALKRLSDGA